MLSAPAIAPDFQKPQETISPAVNALLHSRFTVEDGIQYAAFKPLNASEFFVVLLLQRLKKYERTNDHIIFKIADPLEVRKNSKNATFYYRDANAFVDPRRIFLDITWYAVKGEDEALTTDDFVSCLNPPSQQVIESATLNIGAFENFLPNSNLFLLA